MKANSIQLNFDGSYLLNALYVPATLLSILFSLPQLGIKTTYGRGPHMSLILQVKQLRLRELKEYAHGHTAPRDRAMISRGLKL